MIKLANYKIIKKIASGGMGDVYLAEHTVLETIVAIKSLHNHLVSDESFRKRFRTEAKLQSKLIHPNIVKLIDFQEQKDGLYLIMEYIDGKQLNDYIKQDTGPISAEKIIPLFSKVLSAIDYAHNQGLIHRDIKPANILITAQGDVKLIDFGIAKNDDQDDGLTKTGVQIGTVSYMSPEQVNAEKLDKLTDIYSLGVTLFQMAVGQSPYISTTNTFKIQLQIVNEPFPNPKDFYPGVSEKIETIINKATQKKKTDRYQSCDEFTKALNAPSQKNTEQKEDPIDDDPVAKQVLIRAFIALAVIFVVYLFSQMGDSGEEDDYESYYQSAKQYQEDELYQSAINDYNQCIAIYSDRDSIFAFIAQCYYEQQDYENAITNFSTAINLSNSQIIEVGVYPPADYFFERGKSYSKLTQHIQAQSDFDEAISIDPSNANFHLSQGDDFFLQGRYDSAKQAYIKYLDLNLNYIGYYKRGNANYKLRKLDDAIKDYTKSIELNQTYSNAYRNRGIAKYEICQEGACSDLKKAGDLGDSKAYDEYKRISNNNECD